MTRDLPANDIDEILERSEDDLHRLRGSRILITGSTGFIGSWLTAVLSRSDARMNLGLEIVVLVRGGAGSHLVRTHSSNATPPEVITADLRDPLPRHAAADLVIHTAATISAGEDAASRRVAGTAIEAGMRHLADLFASAAPSRVLFTSSGAVYRPKRAAPSPFTEDDAVVEPGDSTNWYGDAKRNAEEILLSSAAESSFDAIIGRLFSFVGPGMKLDAELAAGDFIADAINGRAVTAATSGTSVRSYQYPTDLTVWLLAMLGRGRASQAYNVGSSSGITIAELAHKIADCVSPSVPCALGTGPNRGRASDYYVPSTTKAEDELHLSNLVDIDEALTRTVDHFLQIRSPQGSMITASPDRPGR